MPRKAFTLVEVLITSIIFGMVLTGVGYYIVFSTRILNQSAAESAAQSFVQRAYEQIQRDVRNGAKLEFVNNSHVKISDIDGTVILCEYKMENGVLKRSKGAWSAADLEEIKPVMSTNQSAKVECSFSKEYADLMKLNISIEMKNNGQIVGKGAIISKIACRNTVVI